MSAVLRLSRRQALGTAMALAAAGASMPSRAAPVVLPASASLPDELARALKNGNPLLVMVSLEGCPFCKVTREHYLGPMQQQGLPVVQVDMRSSQVVRDFKGGMATHEQLIRAWRVNIAPTVLFFGAGGVEVAERLVGGYLPDFYGAYLDGRLSTARAALQVKA